MKTERLYKLVFSAVIGFACVVSLGTRHADAQEGQDQLEESVDLPATECEIAMRPVVDTCYEKTEQAKGTIKQPEAAFYSCFWFEFNSKYPRKIKLTDECYAVAPEAFPLQPLPPHLEREMKLLNPPGSKNDTSGELGY